MTLEQLTALARRIDEARMREEPVDPLLIEVHRLGSALHQMTCSRDMYADWAQQAQDELDTRDDEERAELAKYKELTRWRLPPELPADFALVEVQTSEDRYIGWRDAGVGWYLFGETHYRPEGIVSWRPVIP